MQNVSRHVVRHARQLAHEVGAQAILIDADPVVADAELRNILHTVDLRTIFVTRSRDGAPRLPWDGCVWVAVPDVAMTRASRIKMALLSCLARGLLRSADRILFLTGLDHGGVIDGVLVLDLGTEPEMLTISGDFDWSDHVSPAVFGRALTLATQLAVEGREGRPVGLIFVLGDSDCVLAQSRSLVLNPFRGYPERERNILDPALEETIKEFSALDGAFVVRSDGVLLSAGTQLMPTVAPAPLPKGLGTRHAAAAGITASTHAVAVAVSQSTGALAVFKAGRMVTDIHRPGHGTRLAL